ncbi:hypothetical protein HHI36_014809 [Cryptolaemus montrouzieri]|uniref:DDE Tnp4 domain-containing protein n=1 Tax=Cryptolaemus montrouzieri TaxID=559131 RepID=A0ABD2N3T3_9CUCU
MHLGLRKPIRAKVEKVDKIVGATICLHNWLRFEDFYYNEYVSPGIVDSEAADGSINERRWRSIDIENSALHNLRNCSSNSHSRTSAKFRQEYYNFFNNEGVVPWQFVQIYK